MRGIEIVRTHRPLSRDGVYTIYPDLKTNRTVFCDMTTDGGGWTVSITETVLVGERNRGCELLWLQEQTIQT